MKLSRTMLATVTASTMVFAPVAVAAGNPHAAKTHTPPTHAKAYGYYCQKAGASKKHVAGQKGTPFSQCVAALKALDTKKQSNPSKACATESKKHVTGQKGTPFSQCVSAGHKLLAATTAG